MVLGASGVSGAGMAGAPALPSPFGTEATGGKVTARTVGSDAAEHSAGRVLPFHRRPFFRQLTTLAATLLVFAGGGYYAREQGLFLSPADRAILPLVKAVGERRFFEPRLTGGFKYGPITGPSRGLTGSDPSGNWPLLAAAALLKARSEEDPSAANRRAVAAAQLILGDSSVAVRSLEELCARNPLDATLLSDLSAAYLVRAFREDRQDDWNRGLDAAERALKADQNLVEARYNRALALEALGLFDEADRAWDALTNSAPQDVWVQQGLLRSRHRDRSGNFESSSEAIRAALNGGSERLERAVAGSLLPARDIFDLELVRPAEAPSRLRLAQAILRVSGDPSFVSMAELRSGETAELLAEYAKARILHDQDQMTESSGLLRRIRAQTPRESPLNSWARFYLWHHEQGKTSPAVVSAALALIEGEARSKNWLALAARAAWLRGLLALQQGHLVEAQASAPSIAAKRRSKPATVGLP